MYANTTTSSDFFLYGHSSGQLHHALTPSCASALVAVVASALVFEMSRDEINVRMDIDCFSFLYNNAQS